MHDFVFTKKNHSGLKVTANFETTILIVETKLILTSE